MDGDDVRRRTSELANQLGNTTDSERRQVANDLVPLLIEYWNVHPHSAMEMLEYTTKRLPLSLAHSVVRLVVEGWKRNATYDPTAGGGADHCYMSALILSENVGLADLAWSRQVLPYTLDKELSYGNVDKLPDGARRRAIVQALADSLIDA